MAATWVPSVQSCATISPKMRTRRRPFTARSIRLPTTSAKRAGSGNPSTMNIASVSPASSGLQSFLKTLLVRLRGDHDAGCTRAEARTDESTHRVQEEFVRLIELHEMLGHIHFAPLQAWCELLTGTLVMSEGFITIGMHVCLVWCDYHVAWSFLPCGLCLFHVLYHFCSA